jgi:hypothetical protein
VKTGDADHFLAEQHELAGVEGIRLNLASGKATFGDHGSGDWCAVNPFNSGYSMACHDFATKAFLQYIVLNRGAIPGLLLPVIPMR